MATHVLPPGWPKGVHAPSTPAWEVSASNWLLDLCPPDYRSYEVLKRYPIVLARFTYHHVESARAGAREAYARARTELGDDVNPEVLDAALRALESEGARLNRALREVAMVEDALRGRRWQTKL
jgi:hypothetical protein